MRESTKRPAGAEPKPHQPAEGPRPACGPEEAITCLLEVTRELNLADDLKDGLRRVGELLRQYIRYETFGVLLLDELGRELRFAHAVGFPPEVEQHWRFGMGQGIVGTAAAGRRILVIDDVQEDPRYINACESVRSEIAIPLEVKDRTIGVLDIGGPEPGFFTAEDRRLLKFLADHLANAIETARLYQNMREQAQTLSLLHEVSRELTSILDREELLRKVADLVSRLIDYDVFTVLLWNPRSQLLEPSIAISRDTEGSGRAKSIPLGVGITGTAAALRQPVRVPNVHLDPRYVSCVENFEVASELAVPLVFKERLLGVLDLESRRYDAFSSRHQQLLSTVASSLAIALENASLYGKLRRDEQRLQEDLTTAREVQKRLLPRFTPWIRGLQVGVAYEPARHLGGDFYDFLPYGDGRIAVAVGDVAGKSTSAALYGSLAVGTLREYAGRSRSEPGVILREMNEKLGAHEFDTRFVAMAFGIYDGKERRLTLANSGLPHPYLLRGWSIREIEVGGIPLGLLPDRSYEEVSLDLRVGDAVVICSDGVEESLDAADEELGSERIRATLQRLAGGSAMEIAQGLLEAAQQHAGKAEVYDDRTIVVLKAVPDNS